MTKRRGTMKWTERNIAFRRHHKAIALVALELRSKRQNIKSVRDVCRKVNVTTTAFYAHGKDVGEVLGDCEDGLLKEFAKWIRGKAGRELALTKLLGFLKSHKVYFKKVLNGRDFYMLDKMMWKMKPLLVGQMINDELFTVYEGTLIGMVMNWATIDKFANDKIEEYVKKMMHVRVMKF